MQVLQNWTKSSLLLVFTDFSYHTVDVYTHLWKKWGMRNLIPRKFCYLEGNLALQNKEIHKKWWGT